MLGKSGFITGTWESQVLSRCPLHSGAHQAIEGVEGGLFLRCLGVYIVPLCGEICIILDDAAAFERDVLILEEVVLPMVDHG